MNLFSSNNPPTDLEKELGSYMDPEKNNVNNFLTGIEVKVTLDGETREGFITKQVDDRHFLVKLSSSFTRINPRKIWLKVCRDFAHQSVE